MTEKMVIDLALLGAVPLEVEPLAGLLAGRSEIPFLGRNITLGSHRGLRILTGSTGLGKVNAAIFTSALLERFRILEVWSVGCAGAFAEGPLRVGDVLVAERCILGDEGVLTAERVHSSRLIGIPVLEGPDEEIYDSIPIDQSAAFRRVRALTPPGEYSLADHLKSSTADFPQGCGSSGICKPFRLHTGPSLTVGMASGDEQTARDRFARYGAYAENMEGSAVAQACYRFGTPMLECRGMSNTAGDRRKQNWRMQEAFSHCHAIVARWIELHPKAAK